VLFGAYGLVVALRSGRYAEAFGVIGFVVYLVVVTPGNFHHNYYQLPIVPIGVVLTALGVATAIERRHAAGQWTEERRVNAYAAVLAAALLTTFIRSVSAHNWYEVDQRRLALCDALSVALLPDDRVAFANNLSPDLLFCINRKGWLLEEFESTPERFRQLARDGATVFVTARTYEATVQALAVFGPPLVQTRAYVAYRVGPAHTP
jgi:hypothetical protein